MRKSVNFLIALSGMIALSACTLATEVGGAQGTPMITLPPAETISYEPEEEPIADFMSVSGTIQEINLLYEPSDDRKEPGEYMVLIESNGSLTNFHVDHLTALFLDGEMEVGMAVTGFFDANMPMIMIYPPRHHARVLVSDSFGTVYVDRFDADFVADSHPLQLVINESTEIMFQDGQAFEGELTELENRILAVFVESTADTSPALITPSMVVVLFERAVHPIHHLTEEELAGLDSGFIEPDNWGGGLQLTQEDLDILWDNMLAPDVQIIVDGTVIDAPTPFVNREVGMVMLPVAAIAEALGLNVVGEGADVVIGMGITFVEGIDSYHFGRRAAQQLGAAPELVDGVLFVPINFFHDVLPGAAYIMDGHVIVQSDSSWDDAVE